MFDLAAAYGIAGATITLLATFAYRNQKQGWTRRRYNPLKDAAELWATQFFGPPVGQTQHSVQPVTMQMVNLDQALRSHGVGTQPVIVEPEHVPVESNNTGHQSQ